MSERPIIACVGCGKPIVRWRLDRVACTRACWAKSNHGRSVVRSWSKTSQGKAARSNQKMRRRARRFTDVVDIDFTRIDVFDRDEWICWVCGEKCSDESVPASKAATVDLVIPLSQGGEHTFGNVRCAHFACNVGRSA